ncbi:hypothetical protein V6N13_014803 [Hibiscus sabdariffa]
MASVFLKLSSEGNFKGIGGLLRESKRAIKAWAKSQSQDRNVSINNLAACINELEVKIQTGALPPSTMYQVASLRRKKNQILRLTVENRSFSDPRLIKEAVKNHFSLEYNNMSTLEVESMKLPFSKLRPEQAGQLESMFSEEEVIRG